MYSYNRLKDFAGKPRSVNDLSQLYLQKRSNYKRYNRHQFQQNIERWSGSIFKWITHRISNYSRLMWFGTFAVFHAVDDHTFFHHFLGVIPGSSCIGLE